MATRKIKDAKDTSTNELIYFRGHAQATYMSDGTSVEDKINGISAGGGSVDLSNYYNKSEVDSKINYKQDKATRNMIINSNFDNGGSISHNAPWSYQALGGSSTRDSIVVGGYNGYNEANLKYAIYGQPVILEAGKTYTLSCVYLFTSNYGYSYLDYNHLLGEKNIIASSNVTQGSSGIRLNTSNGYQKAYITFTVSQTSERILAIGNDGNSSDAGLYITCIQLEEGNTATEYKRAEETYITTSAFQEAIKSIKTKSVVSIASSSDTINIENNQIVVVNEPTEYLSLTFVASGSSLDEYSVMFKTSASGCTLVVPEELQWANGIIPTIEGGCDYELSVIRKNADLAYTYNAVITKFS